MKIKRIDGEFSICRVSGPEQIDLSSAFCFAAKTDEESSLVCETARAPRGAEARDDGWAAFRIEGVLDFSLVGILARISSLMAENGIGIFAVSTYNTDYIFTKKENIAKAVAVLAENGYETV